MLPQGAPVGLAEGRTALAAGLAFSAICGPATSKPLRDIRVSAGPLLGVAFGGDDGGNELARWPLTRVEGIMGNRAFHQLGGEPAGWPALKRYDRK